MKKLILITSITSLMACGGGGGGNGDSGGSTNNNINNGNTVNQAPSNVAFNTVTALNPTTIEAAWSLAKDDKTIASTMRYQVHLSESANFSPSSATLKFEQQGALATQLTGLKASTVYFIKLIVIDGDNAQTISDQKVVTTPNVPTTPINAKLADIVITGSGTTMKLSWLTDNSTVPNTVKYQVHVSETANFTPTASTLKIELTGKEINLGGFKPSTVYYVKIVVVNDNNRTTSNEKSTTTLASGVINKAPTDVVISQLTPTKNTISLKWSAKDDYSSSKLKYDVYVSKSVDATNLVYSGSSTSFTVSNLEVNSLYYVKVIAVDEQGLKSTSNLYQIYTEKELMPKIYSLNVSEGGNLPEEYTIQAYWQLKPYKNMTVVVENVDFTKQNRIYLYCESKLEFFKKVFYDNVWDNWKTNSWYPLTQEGGVFANNPMGFTMFTTGFHFGGQITNDPLKIEAMKKNGRITTIEGNKVTLTYDPTKMRTEDLVGLPSNDYFVPCGDRKYILKYEEYANTTDSVLYKPLPNGSASTYFYSYWTQN